MKACAFSLFLLLGPASSSTHVISGEVTSGSSKHPVYVALWQADGFLVTAVRTVRFEAGVRPAFQFEVAEGRWALSAFEDTNHNGVLDMGLFGPTEPNGFFKPFTGHHKPSFEEVAFQVEGPLRGLTIALR